MCSLTFDMLRYFKDAVALLFHNNMFINTMYMLI